ncbi:MAG: TusE/DsrC/DsvC family sulfur relay protein [Desulfurivibrio sp.]|nr:TusE/DsrC/DsvC family sulfur relay protein [Desulfurivibrio sp.]
MATIEHKGKTFNVDEDGFLTKGMEEWSEEWVDYVKSIEGIDELTDEHPQNRRHPASTYFRKNGVIAPMVRYPFQDHRLYR